VNSFKGLLPSSVHVSTRSGQLQQLETLKHGLLDKPWKDWAQDQRRLGRKRVTVQELHDVMADAIERAPITDAQKSAQFTLLHDELFQEHG
jgi:hypothetical protein